MSTINPHAAKNDSYCHILSWLYVIDLQQAGLLCSLPNTVPNLYFRRLRGINKTHRICVYVYPCTENIINICIYPSIVQIKYRCLCLDCVQLITDTCGTVAACFSASSGLEDWSGQTGEVYVWMTSWMHHKWLWCEALPPYDISCKTLWIKLPVAILTGSQKEGYPIALTHLYIPCCIWLVS